jgi:hypothetical protein
VCASARLKSCGTSATCPGDNAPAEFILDRKHVFGCTYDFREVLFELVHDQRLA